MQNAMTETYVYNPTRKQIEETNIFKFAKKLGLHGLDELYSMADSQRDRFWNEVVKDTGVIFFEGYGRVIDDSKGKPWSKWFVGGKVNIAYNAAERFRNSDAPAIEYERENGTGGTITFRELDRRTGKLAGSLLDIGVKKGDRVGIYMPLSPESVIALYSIMRIGAVAVPMFSGYGSEAVASRVEDAGIKVMFVTSAFERRGKQVHLLKNLDGLDRTRLIVFGESGSHLSFDDMIQNGTYTESVHTDSEDPAIILYTSGTTGKPKGTVHVHGGALVNIVKEVKYYTDMKPGDTMFWISDPGWMMGPWSMIGSNALGCSIFVYDGALDYPEETRLWDLVRKHRITVLGVSPTLIRTFRASKLEKPIRGVKCFGSTGEPWDTESWTYLFNVLGEGKVPICNISGGTDIIGCFLASHPAMPMKPRCLYKGLGMSVSVYDESGKEIEDSIGYLVAEQHLPSMTRGLWHAEEKYLETYWSRFPGVWFHGDWAEQKDGGYFYLYGRADDVIKIAGKRVGPGEVEDVVARVNGVRECAVAGVPDSTKGEAIAVFAAADRREEIEREIRLSVERSLGKPFSPKYVILLESLPKTRNGKIMRRIARNAFLDRDCGDVSSLEDASIVEKIREIGKIYRGGHS
jgi:acetyl-CoA synthetase